MASEPIANKSAILVGDYLLMASGQPHYLLNVRRRDGGRVPAALAGLWSSSHDFQRAAEEYHGETYSNASLKARTAEEMAARRESEAAKEREYHEALAHGS